METLTTVKKMLKESMIYVPNSQHAYSWGSQSRNDKNSQVSVFLSDLSLRMGSFL